MPKKVLVTGATGFLGRHLATRLHQWGYPVTATGRNPKIGQMLTQKGIHFVASELENRDQIMALCKQQEVIFHCAALSAPWGDYALFYQSNVVGTQHIIAGCRQHSVQRLVYISTPSIYADFTQKVNINESSSLPDRSINAYAKTKRLAEKEIDQAYDQFGLPVVTIRPRAIFGPHDPAILPRLLQANQQGGIPLIRGGKALIDLTYVDNVVDVLIQCMNSGEHILGQKYNISNEEPRPLLSLLEMLFSRLGEPLHTRKLPYAFAFSVATLLEWKAHWFHPHREPLLTRATVDMLGNSFTLDVSRARKDLLYQPRIGVKEGMDRYVTWYQDPPSSLSNLR